MLQELSARLSRIIEEKRLKEKVEQDLRAVEAELQDKSARFTLLSTQLEKEKVDVEKLEHTSLTALFYSVLGSREQQLEKERQEMLAAQLSYQQTKHQVAYLEREQNRLLAQIEKLAGIEAEYEVILAEKENFLRQSNQTVARELMENSELMAILGSEVKEISEAIAAGNDVILGLDQVIKSLESAENWGIWDILGGGLISTAIKHSRIDDARKDIDNIQIKISRFKRELADVREQVDTQINIGEFVTFADFIFDGLIIDWVVQSKITDSLSQSKRGKSKIAQVVNQLEATNKIIIDKYRALEEKRAQIIEST